MKRFEVKYLPGAISFLESLEKKAAEKLIFNISKSQVVNDTRIFKKLKNSNIWEFMADYSSCKYRLFAFWDKRENTFVKLYTWNLKEESENSQKGD